ncbi:MAG: 50S ribosomal protein L9 [Bacteriovoracaceae bacterium]|nr:50S ribosomal protein L9 [Bacteriovoracaceae bacterium]
MKVILTERVPTLGNVGEIVNVSAGHARNYLLPNSLAVVADDSNKKSLDHSQKMLAKKMDVAKKAAEETKTKLDQVTLEITKRVAANGRLFGAVSSLDLSKLLGDQGLEVEKRMITLETPIKTAGKFTAKAKLFEGVESSFSVNVTIDAKQLEDMKRKAEAAKKAKEKAKEAAAAAAEAGEGEGETETPLTEEQKLAEEANKIVRG